MDLASSSRNGGADVPAAVWGSLRCMEPPIGAHLVTPRPGYNHHGIYVGHDKVVHYAGLAGALRRGPVEEVSLADFSAGGAIWIAAGPPPKYVEQEAARRARSRLGEDCYRVLSNNCEHFCTWCLYGKSESEQVRAFMLNPWVALRILIILFGAWLASAAQVSPVLTHAVVALTAPLAPCLPSHHRAP